MVFLRVMRRRAKPRVIWHGKREVRKGLRGIGNTPLVEILYSGHAPIFLKAEHLNPTESHKDRAYLKMISDLIRRGVLKPGMTIVDYTTGNGGVSCAFVGRELEYPVIVTMPEHMSQERKDQIEYYGARMILTRKELFVKGAREKAERIVRSDPERYVLIDQSDNPANIETFRDMGVEVLGSQELRERRVAAFVAAVGTGASISGIAQIFKEENPGTFVMGVEAIESPSTYAAIHGIEFTHRPHDLIGVSPGKVAVNTRLEVIDDAYPIDQKERRIGLKLLREVGLPLGHTSAANLFVAKKIARELGEGSGVVLTIGYDAAWKYYSEDPISERIPLGRVETAETDRARVRAQHYFARGP